MTTAFLIALVLALAVPQLVWSPEWPQGPLEIEGTVEIWPRETYFFVRTEIGRFVATKTPGLDARAGQRVRIWGRWSQPDGTFAHWLRGEGAIGWFYSSSVKVIDEYQPWWIKALEFVRLSIAGKLHPIGQAMLLGDRNIVPKEVVQTFDRTGTSHLLAASGLHLGIVVGLLAFLTKKKWPIVAIALLYIVLTGFKLGMIRSAVMVSLTFMHLPFTRWQRLLIALLVILWIWPHAIWSVGLWLSFLSTGAILGIWPVLRKLPRRWFSYPLGIAMTTTACQLATLPVVMYVFGRVAFPIGIPANLFAIPVATIILYASFLAIPLPPPLWMVFSYVAFGASEVLIRGLALLP